jgi:hypothetical protein
MTAQQFNHHLLTKYGNIMPTDLAHNDSNFRTAYKLAQTIGESLFSQLEDAMDFANGGGNPYTAAQDVTNTYSIIFSTGLFSEACRNWHQ